MSDVHSTARRASLKVVNAIGMEMHVDVAGVDDAYAAMRTFGRMGWHSSDVELPIELPYAMADVFDWSLIGAYSFVGKTKEGADIQTIAYRGKYYKRRDISEKKEHGKVMPASVFFSRGASEDDPEEEREGATGGNRGYMPLAKFRGAGKVIDAYCVPKQQTQTRADQRKRATEPAMASEEQLARVRRSCSIRDIALDSDQVRELLRGTSATGEMDLSKITYVHADTFIRALEKLPIPPAVGTGRNTAQNGAGEAKGETVVPDATPTAAAASSVAIGTGDRLPDNVVRNVTIALERAGYVDEAFGNLVAEVSMEIDGSVTYDVARLSMAAVNELLALSKRSRVGTAVG